MARPAIQAARVVISVSDTQQKMVLAESVVGVAPNPRHQWWALPIAGLGLVVLAAVVLGTFFTASRFSSITKPYAIVPSGAEPVKSFVELDDVERYRADGTFLFVTIRQPEMSLLSWLMFHDENDIELGTYEQFFGTSTREQVQTQGRLQMFTAQQAAEFVALEKLGFAVEKKSSVVIADIVCLDPLDPELPCKEYAPSGELLEPNDLLISVEGQVIDTVDDVTKALVGRKPGEFVMVEFQRIDLEGTQSGEVELTVSPEEPDRTLIGFRPQQIDTVGASPFPIEITTQDVGGPSAGLAFTLTLIDELTDGELTGGRNIAVTGTIDIDGNVGAIGGLPQKASAVRQTGAKYFLVPASQSPESLAAARQVVEGDVEIIPVATLDEALAALGELGGNVDALGQPGANYSTAD